MGSNVIDFQARQKARSGRQQRVGERDQSQVVDMTARREAEIDEERRQVRRTILTEFISTYIVLPKIGLQRISLYDVSKTGISFDIDMAAGQFDIGDEVAVRIYLNKNTYFPFVVNIANGREVANEAVYRHGATIVQGSVNDVALHHFISFIETVSTALKKDDGDVMVSNIKN